MERKRSVGKRIAQGCGGLIGLVIILGLAGYAIVHAIGARQVNNALARIKTSGAPTTWEQAIPPRIPDEQNAAPLYQSAFAHLRLRVPSRRALNDDREGVPRFLKAATPADRRALRKGVTGIVAANAPALRLAQQAAKRPKCRFNRNWDNPITMLVPELSRLKDLSRVASVRAVLQADKGDLAGALDSWSINLSIANHLEGDPSLLGQLTRYSVLHVAAASLRGILQDDGLSREQCLDLARALGRVNIGPAFIKCFEAERSSSLWKLDYLRKKPLWTLNYVREKPLPPYASL